MKCFSFAIGLGKWRCNQAEQCQILAAVGDCPMWHFIWWH